MIDVLNNYKGSTSKAYKSNCRAILNWVAEKVLNLFADENESYDFAEERRLFYAALARAKEYVYIRKARRGKIGSSSCFIVLNYSYDCMGNLFNVINKRYKKSTS